MTASMLDSVLHIRRPNPRVVRRALQTVLAVAALSSAACHGLLDVSDPNYIRDSDVANATGANARRAEVLFMFNNYLGQDFTEVGLFTDELTVDVGKINQAYYNDMQALDQRDIQAYADHHVDGEDPHLGRLDRIVTTTSLALQPIRAYSPATVKGDYLAQLFVLRGYAVLQMAEDICSGFPINDVTSDNQPLLSGPYATDSAIGYAITAFDSALADVTDSTQYGTIAHILKARALLDLGQFAAASTELHDVPTSFTYTTDPTLTTNLGGYFNSDQGRYFTDTPIADREGGTGLGFLSEGDTIRIKRGYAGQSVAFPAESLFASAKYPPNTPIILVSGTEARLMDAEIALHNQDASWLTILNDLRAPAGLAPLVDPGTDSARVDLIYHERAFWMYLTGRRLGDMRRLIRNYGRGPETVFPTGLYPVVGRYKTGTAIAFSFLSEAKYNSKITHGCAAS